MADNQKRDAYADARAMLMNEDGTLWDFPSDETDATTVHAIATLALVDAVRELNTTLTQIRNTLPGWGS